MKTILIFTCLLILNISYGAQILSLEKLPCLNGKVVAIYDVESFTALYPCGKLIDKSLNYFFSQGGSRLKIMDISSDTPETLKLTEEFDILLAPFIGRDDNLWISKLTELSENNGAFFVMNVPKEVLPNEVSSWSQSIGLASNSLAIYYPHLKIGDEIISTEYSIAALYQWTDTMRGIWVAPAGLSLSFDPALKLANQQSDYSCEDLRDNNINCLREIVGETFIWGERVFNSSDNIRYVHVQRTKLEIEKSLKSDLAWVFFEPNDEPLWAAVRKQITNFLYTEYFREGAFYGGNPLYAFFVKCDRSIMTDEDLANGKLIIQYGFAPSYPSEFISTTLSFTMFH